MKKSILHKIAFTAAILFSMPIHAMDEQLINQQVDSNQSMRCNWEMAEPAEKILAIALLLSASSDVMTATQRLNIDWERAISGEKILTWVERDDDYTHINNLLKKAKESSISLKLKVGGSTLDLYKILNCTNEHNLLFHKIFLISELDKTEIGRGLVPEILAKFKSDIVVAKDGWLGASPIEELDLSNNKQGWRFVNPIAAATHSGYLGNLKTLNLRGTDIGDPEAECISHWLINGRLKNLQILELGNNQITPMGLASFTIIEGKDVPHLTKLSLDSNPLGGYRSGGEFGMVIDERLIQTILQHIPTIKEIDLRSTGIDPEYLDDLKYLYINKGVKVHKKVKSECTIS